MGIAQRSLRSAQTGSTGQAISRGVDGAGSSSDFSCGLCNVSVGNDCIGCDRCSLWFHPPCTGLKADTIKCILRDGGDGIRYVCSACRYQSKANGNTSNNNSSITDVSQLFETVKSLANDVARLTQQVSLLITNNQRQTVGENSEIIDRQNL